MHTEEYRKLKGQLDRIEGFLAKLAGQPLERPEPPASAEPPEPPPITPEMSAVQRRHAIQAEGHFILETQGIDAYKKFWQAQVKKSRPPRVKRAV